MKTRVISTRVSYDTIAYCYLLQESAGREVRNKPVSAIVSETLEAVVEASIRMSNIPKILSQEEAEQILGEYLDKGVELPGVDLVGELRSAQAGKEKPKPQADEVQLPEAATHAIAETATEEKPVSALDIIEQVAKEEEEKDAKVLVESVVLTQPERVPVQEEKPACPWESAPRVEVEEVENDILYQEANAVDELFGVAVRVVYSALKQEDWSSDRAAKLARKVFEEYKKWRERYEGKKAS